MGRIEARSGFQVVPAGASVKSLTLESSEGQSLAEMSAGGREAVLSASK